MLKKIAAGTTVLLLALLMGCAKPIMPPLEYNQPIDIQVNKNACLNWNCGKEYASAVPTQYNTNSGVVGLLVSSAVDSVGRANNPSRYTMSYGKAEQVIFMTSLRDVLEKNQVFNQVCLGGDSVSSGANAVLIEVFFKSARVASPERGYNITLTVDLNIQANGRAPFKRTYVVQSGIGSGLGSTFCAQQTEVSTRLLKAIIKGIEDWYSFKGKSK